jgi:hypothetical protein
VLNGKLTPPTYFVGFVLRPATKDRPARVLAGTQEGFLGSFQPVAPTPKLVKGLELQLSGAATFEMHEGLAVALQCHARGWKALAQELWAASLKQELGVARFKQHSEQPPGAFFQPANLPNRTAVAFLAWAYSGNELVQTDSDRAKTARRMKALLAAEPRLSTGTNRALLKSLEAALVPSKAKPGTVERMIDDLVEMCNIDRRYDDPDPRYARLAEMGFAAVPALLEHLDDNRLTRSVQGGVGSYGTWILCVENVASDLLQDLAGYDVSRQWQRGQSGAFAKSDVWAWWDKARKVGEEAYLLPRVLPSGAKEGWPDSRALDIIAKRYPRHLPRLYKTVLDECPKLQSWPLAKAVAKSSLPAATKRELFLYAARHKNLVHRRSGLEYLRELDPAEFMAILLATLEAFPSTPKEPYWGCPEVGFVHVVLATDDARAWKTLEKVAKRSDVGLRMEFLNPMNYAYLGDRHRQQRLDFLAAFLGDAEAPDVKANAKMFEGPHAGFTFNRLEVRDLAAMRIASILGMPDSPDMEWTAEQWQELRDRVRKALKK